MLHDESNITFYNRDIKKYLHDYYCDKIQFAANPRVNESELFFSSAILPGDLAAKLKNQNVLSEAGKILHKYLSDISFGLED